MTIQNLISTAVKDGWAWTDDWSRASAAAIENSIRLANGRIAAGRNGRSIELLTPTEPAKAHLNSMSAVYGQGAQPFHTDGAHLETPPDVLIFRAAAASDVPTLLWNPRRSDDPDLDHGLFTVRDGGRHLFLATARSWSASSGTWHHRFDPVCMSPSDARATRAAAALTDPPESEVIRFEWAAAGRVLAINNRSFLHARADATSHPGRLLERIALRLCPAEMS
ncbi:hypothetical protein [Pimelobacter simplex]|uniref:hypothetical protein n=1 Tax=Nocardioides simplex TaxID=2045 RepID=UPI003AABD8C4